MTWPFVLAASVTRAFSGRTGAMRSIVSRNGGDWRGDNDDVGAAGCIFRAGGGAVDGAGALRFLARLAAAGEADDLDVTQLRALDGEPQ